MPNISDETFSQQALVMNVKQKFSEVLKIVDVGHFKWNCIQVVNVSSFSRIVDEHMSGVIVNVSIGKDSFGSFSIIGKLVTVEGGMAMSEATDVINCSPGCRPWTLMRFALCRGEARID